MKKVTCPECGKKHPVKYCGVKKFKKHIVLTCACRNHAIRHRICSKCGVRDITQKSSSKLSPIYTLETCTICGNNWEVHFENSALSGYGISGSSWDGGRRWQSPSRHGKSR